MRHHGHSKWLLLLATAVIIAGYVVLYMQDTSLEEAPCSAVGGACRANCLVGEAEAGWCGELLCCVTTGLSVTNADIANAVKQRDITMCSRFGESQQASCKILVLDSIANDFALKYDDASYCESISSTGIKDSCFQAIAWKTNNMDMCSQISTPNARDRCMIYFAQKQKNWQICAENVQVDINRDQCFKQLAVATKSIETCSQISIESIASDCMLKVELALNSENNVDCSIIAKDDCSSVKGCKPVLITDPLESLKDAYAGCARNTRHFCETTGGTWIVKRDGLFDVESCDCGSEAYYEGYGCFDCSKFEHARNNCLKRIV
ncbi:MAG: hypothetical protein KJ955_08580 [Nanoarchaeota archaeon]|nr:hypothetical protein [Nanoarchaeota archaeon]